MILAVRFTSSGKEKEKKTPRSNNLYEMELIETKITPRQAPKFSLSKRKKDQMKTNLGIGNVSFKEMKIFYPLI